MFRALIISLIAAAILVLGTLCYPLPKPVPRPLSWAPDVIVVLGGGDEARGREAVRLAKIYPEAPILITGDGGQHEKFLRNEPATRERLLIEPKATSTWENAHFSKPWFDRIHAERIVLVTNWFHVSRAEAVFRKVVPWMEIETAFEPAPEVFSVWDRETLRREKFATLFYFFRYGIRTN